MKLTLLLSILFVGLFANSQPDTTIVGPILNIVNRASYAKLHNIVFHYCINSDSGWGVLFYNLKSQYMLPGDTASSGEITTNSLHFYRYEYDYEVNGSHFHKTIDTSFVVKQNETATVTLATFYILPPWWKTDWFYFLIGLILLVLMWLLLKYYIRLKLIKQRRELEKQLAVQLERQRISSEMHDDIGASLLGIKLQSEMLMQKTDSLELQTQMQKLHNSITDVSSKVREVVWSLNVENNSLLNLLSFVHQQAHKIFEHSWVSLSVISPDDLPDIVISGIHRRHIYLIIKEALHNALRHASANSVAVKFLYKTPELQIRIEDDGKGIVQNKATVESSGLGNMKRRAQQLNGNMDILTSSGGTIIILSFPYTKA